MASPARTKQLGIGTFTSDNAYHVLYTVPASTTTIVKGVFVRNGGTGTAQFYVGVGNAGGALLALYGQESAAQPAGFLVRFTDYVTLAAGQTLLGRVTQVSGAQGQCSFVASGSELT